MFRLLLIGFFSWIIYALYKKMLKRAVGQRGRAVRTNPIQTVKPGEMVACAKCETFVLKNEALEKNGSYYCSKSCA
ncbi:MAG: PP0621 family protein [Pseudomonadota bacterium]